MGCGSSTAQPGAHRGSVVASMRRASRKIDAFLKVDDTSDPAHVAAQESIKKKRASEGSRLRDQRQVLGEEERKEKISTIKKQLEWHLSENPQFAKENANAMQMMIRIFEQELKAVMTLKEYKKGENIVSMGDRGSEMFFIKAGIADVCSKDESEVYCTLSSGAFFGEICLLLPVRRTATVKARTNVLVNVLERQNLFELLEKYPPIAQQFKKGAAVKIRNQFKFDNPSLVLAELDQVDPGGTHLEGNQLSISSIFARSNLQNNSLASSPGSDSKINSPGRMKSDSRKGSKERGEDIDNILESSPFPITQEQYEQTQTQTQTPSHANSTNETANTSKGFPAEKTEAVTSEKVDSVYSNERLYRRRSSFLK
eukprot:Nk52_evm42s151 gene=Nk52_evmTU42s151